MLAHAPGSNPVEVRRTYLALALKRSRWSCSLSLFPVLSTARVQAALSRDTSSVYLYSAPFSSQRISAPVRSYAPPRSTVSKWPVLSSLAAQRVLGLSSFARAARLPLLVSSLSALAGFPWERGSRTGPPSPLIVERGMTIDCVVPGRMVGNA
jgi:hypothetical protein